MNWHEWMGIASGMIAAGMIIPYLIAMVRGTTRPNVISWSLWTVVVFITLLAQIRAGAAWSSFLLIGTLVANSLVLIFCMRGYGYNRFATIEKITLLCAVLAVVLWLVTSSPLLAMICALTADSVAYLPTFVKIIRYPYSETAWYWAALVGADLLALYSVTQIIPTNILFPIVYGALNALILIALALVRNTHILHLFRSRHPK